MKKCLPAILALSAFIQTANAFVVTIEPDDYGIGADLSNVSPYVTLQKLEFASTPSGNVGVALPVYSRLAGSIDGSPSPSPTGDLSFGPYSFIQVPGPDDETVIRMGLGLLFHVPVEHVSLIANSFHPHAIATFWSAFDSLGSLIGSGISGGSALTGQNYLVDIAVPNMVSVIIGVEDGTASANYDHLVLSIDDRYAQVSEPGVLALLGAGLGCLALKRRRAA